MSQDQLQRRAEAQELLTVLHQIVKELQEIRKAIVELSHKP